MHILHLHTPPRIIVAAATGEGGDHLRHHRRSQMGSYSSIAL